MKFILRIYACAYAIYAGLCCDMICLLYSNIMDLTGEVGYHQDYYLLQQHPGNLAMTLFLSKIVILDNAHLEAQARANDNKDDEEQTTSKNMATNRRKGWRKEEGFSRGKHDSPSCRNTAEPWLIHRTQPMILAGAWLLSLPRLVGWLATCGELIIVLLMWLFMGKRERAIKSGHVDVCTHVCVARRRREDI